MIDTISNLTSTEPNHEKLNVAFVGGAYDSAAGRLHRAAIAIDQRYDLVSGCFSRDIDKNRATGAEYGVEQRRVYSNLDALLQNESNNLAAVIVLTPQDQHGMHVSACLEAGLPVICEKALVTSSSEALKIRKQLIERNGFLAVTYNYTGYPMIRELKHMIASGMLGKIHQVEMEMPQEGFARVAEDGTPIRPQEWRLRDGMIPTVYLDLAVHLHMMARFLLDATPEDLVALSSSNGNFPEIIDSTQCLVRYSGGIHCGVWFSKTALGYRNGLRIRVFGNKGSAKWIQENPEYLFYSDNNGRNFVMDRSYQGIMIANKPRYQRFKAGHPAGFLEAFANYYLDVAEAIFVYRSTGRLDFGSYVFGVNESIEGLKMLETIALSSRSHKWESVNFS
jgi:predicted dehydrogenase